MTETNPIREIVKTLVIKAERLDEDSKERKVVDTAIDHLNEIDEQPKTK